MSFEKLFFLLSCCCFFAGGSGYSVEIIAHRGASFIAPENTVAAFKLGYEMGADAVETDVWMTKDKSLVCIHDETTSATTNGALKVTEALTKDVRELDAGKWKGEKYTGEKIPFLGEALNTIPENKKMFVEIKHGEKILPYVFELFAKMNIEKKIVIIGFNFDTMAKAKEMAPNIPVYWLYCSTKDKATNKSIPYSEEIIKKAKDKKLDGLNLNYGGLTEEFVKKAKKEGLKVYVWTVNDVEETKRLVKIGVDGITTDKPDVMLKVVNK